MSIVSQRNFASGEVTPDIYSRVDFERYQTGLRTLRNMWVRKAGGVENRPGTEWIGEECQRLGSFSANEDGDSRTCRLVEFVFDDDNAYIIEMTYGALRFIKNGDYVYEAAKTITAFSAGVITSNAHGFSVGDEVKVTVTDSTGTWSRNGRVGSAAANTFTVTALDTVTTLDATGFVSGTASRIYRVASFGFTDGVSLNANLFNYRIAQSGNEMIFAHKWGIHRLVRTSDTSWALSALTSFAPSQVAPTGLGVSTAGTGAQWVVTAVSATTGEESVASGSVVAAVPTSAAPATLTWTGASGAGVYNVYRNDTGQYGYVGSSNGTAVTFIDRGYTPNTAIQFVTKDVIPYSVLNYPACVTYYQQRLILGNIPANTESLFFSQIGNFRNFQSGINIQDDQSFSATIVSRKVNSIRHLLDLSKLIALTAYGETVINAQDDVITPLSVAPKTQTFNGANKVRPIVIDDSALFVQARGNSLRDLAFDYQVDGYRGNDVSIFARHLFESETITDLAFQQTPHSIAWCVRSDGVLTAVTFVKDQGIIGWHRHDFQDGIVESVACIPEGSEDALYMVIKRTIDGRSTRYIEKLTTRYIDTDAPEDMRFLDSHLTYDGTNTGVRTMTLSGGTNWTYDELLTITASSAFFLSSDVGNQIHFNLTDGTQVRFTLHAYTSSTVMTGYANLTVPVAIRSTATTSWAKAVDTVSGLWHIEDEEVSVLGDGNVVANPNNATFENVLTVTNGSITLDECYSVIQVGLPYTSDFETLDVDSPQRSKAGKGKLVGKVTLQFQKTRGVYAGPKPPTDDDTDPLEGLEELKIRNEEDYDDPVALSSSIEDIILRPEWNSNGRVFIRQIDPLPVTILAVHGEGIY